MDQVHGPEKQSVAYNTKDLGLLLEQEAGKDIWEFGSSKILVTEITLYTVAIGIELETGVELP